MSQYQKSCTICKHEIEMSDRSGKWMPYNLDGTFHNCRDQKVTNGKGKEKEKELTVEERLKRLEEIVLDPRK